MSIETVAAKFGISESEVARAYDLYRSSIVVDGSAVVYLKDQSIPIRWDRYTDGGVTVTNHTVCHPDADFVSALAQINDCRRWIEENSEKVMLVESVDDIHAAKSLGKGGIVFGPQDAAYIEKDLGRIGTVYDLGVRVIQLTYQSRNLIGDGCGEHKPAGLSDFGIEAVKEMQRMGILVDLAHTSHETSFDAVEVAEKPVVITHAHPAALTPNIRAKSDDLIKAVAETGGVIGLTLYSKFVELNDSGKRPTARDFMAHVDYLVDLVGPDHVAIGTDFDEAFTEDDYLALPNKEFVKVWKGDYKWGDHLVEDLGDVVQMPNLAVAMVAAGYDDETITKILGGNFMRVFSEAWAN